MSANRLFSEFQGAWSRAAHHYHSYELVVPGTARFVCQPLECDAWCCRALSVPLGEGDVARMRRLAGIEPAEFLESENGEPIALPLAQPYLLARGNGRCILLGDALACTRYDARPAACRLYPHQVVFVNRVGGRPATVGAADARLAVTAVLRGETVDPLPLLIHHLKCPGFTGPPLTASDWRALLEETARLQFPDEEAGRPPAA